MTQDKITLIAIDNVMRDIVKKQKSIRKKISDVNADFKVVINGDEYLTENEVLDAYGSDIITSAQKDTALDKFMDHERFGTKTLEKELWYWNELYQSLLDVKERLKND